ncbi:CoA ester lyase [Nonomuraea sp. NPDC048916]|uniref:HpcH/HpaI aldolase/citrate lyase family protein n=1 Tax=Nonomuraea sp. NPDC048916 TaxID=3154232 RepID=UPI0033D2E4E0
MRPYKSLLFVPGHRGDWVDKAVRAGTDAVILDLEDAVPEHLKAEARQTVAESVARLHAEHPEVGVLVRPNALGTPHVGRDLAAVVRPGLDALLLPMIYTAEDVVRYDALVGYFESEQDGLDAGSVHLVPTLETARSVANCEELAVATPRVASLLVAAAKGADIAREIGFEWTLEGLETLHLRSRALIACRAAGITHPICGIWQDVSDLDGLAVFSAQNHRLGFRGQVLLHPSHVRTINATYGLDEQELDRYRRMVAAFEAAEAEGRAAVLFEGEHIDIAHVQTARRLLEHAGRS